MDVTGDGIPDCLLERLLVRYEVIIMSNILMVPVHLNALYLPQEQQVVEAMADFSRQPYFNGQRDVNPDVANISEEIVSQPFQNQNLPLNADIHLHWALPDALTKTVGIRVVRKQVFEKTFQSQGEGIWEELITKGWIKKIDDTQASVISKDRNKETLENRWEAHRKDIEAILNQPLGTTFPPVPNRWLVIRSGNGKDLEKWVVESDYLYPEGQENPGSVNIIYRADPDKKKYQPFRYLGRKISWEEWSPDTNADYLEWLTAVGHEQLTSVGYGDPTFAAFYPNCHSVFGFYDNYTGDVKDLQYDIIGWYSKPELDYLSTFIKHFKNTYQAENNHDPTNKEYLKAIKEEFKWALTPAPNEKLSDLEQIQMLCYARITFDTSKSNGSPTTLSDQVTIAVGNTGTEALSAYLAKELAKELTSESDEQFKKNKSIIEEQLEALYLAPSLEHRHLDIGFKFKEARHSKGFSAVKSGILWTIRSETVLSSPANATDAHNQAQITLPHNIAHLLNTLNSEQQKYNRALDEIESMRERLFSDWYKYMLCAYPPEDSKDDYPDIDAVKYYIKEQGIAPLKQKIEATGDLRLDTDATGKIANASANYNSSLSKPSLAEQLARAINELVAAIDNHNQNKKTNYVLRQVSSARYYLPNEPVVLITGEGDDVKLTQRHGYNELLECKILPDSSVQDPINKDVIEKIIDVIQNNNNSLFPKESIAFNTWTQNPWHPFLLEWEVEFFPTYNKGNLYSDSRSYKQDFITKNYTLAEHEVDLSILKNGDKTTQSANVYSGYSILTPHAGIQLKKKLEDYLQKAELKEQNKKLLDTYYQEEKIPKEQQTQNYLSQNIDKIKDWYQGKPDDKNAQNPVYTALCAYQKLQKLNYLSQALGGFNAGLLMHKQTMQLSVADPLGFDDYQAFAQEVRDAVQDSIRIAPQPLNDFNPIRAGEMKILRLALVDTFGQKRNFDFSQSNYNLVTTELMGSARDYKVVLPPRLAQPARINFRWLSADNGNQEMNAHPATTPICGWILPNNLDSSLMIYDNQGQALGSIDQNADWEAAPGSMAAVYSVSAIANEHLRKVVEYLAVKPDETKEQKQKKREFLTIPSPKKEDKYLNPKTSTTRPRHLQEKKCKGASPTRFGRLTISTRQLVH